MKKTIYNLIARYLIGKKFIMKNWLIGHHNEESVFEDIEFTIKGYNRKTKELDIEITDIYIPVFLEDYKNGKIQKCII